MSKGVEHPHKKPDPFTAEEVNGSEMSKGVEHIAKPVR